MLGGLTPLNLFWGKVVSDCHIFFILIFFVLGGWITLLLWLFTLLFVFGLILIIMGYCFDVVIMDMTGMIMLFLLGLSLLSTGLDYKVGSSTVNVYGDNFSEYSVYWDELHPDDFPVSGDVFLFHTNTSDVYGHHDMSDGVSFRFGWFLVTLGSLGFVLSLFRL